MQRSIPTVVSLLPIDHIECLVPLNFDRSTPQRHKHLHFMEKSRISSLMISWLTDEKRDGVCFRLRHLCGGLARPGSRCILALICTIIVDMLMMSFFRYICNNVWWIQRISYITSEHPLFFDDESRVSVAKPVQLPSLMRRVKIRRPMTRDGKVNGYFLKFPLTMLHKTKFPSSPWLLLFFSRNESVAHWK